MNSDRGADSTMTLTNVPGIRVGHAQVPGGGSGCTVVLGPFRGAVEARGLATGTRELDVLSPEHLVGKVDAVLLAGGSAFGLAAAEGVMKWLADQGQGFDTGVAPVPIVAGAVIFDLGPGVGWPGPMEGYRACQDASSGAVKEGRCGAGAGATVGKVLGPRGAGKGGVGSAARKWGDHWIGALAVVNALGDVVGPDGKILAGARSPMGDFLDTDTFLLKGTGPEQFADSAEEEKSGPLEGPIPGTNTTLAVVATDLPLTRVDLGRLARMTSGAFPRAISPVNTPFDGDVLFAISTGDGPVGLSPGQFLSLGVVARTVTEEAIRRAVSSPPRGAGGKG
jgi:L-aminopeptidase/D-esterase-like protein